MPDYTMNKVLYFLFVFATTLNATPLITDNKSNLDVIFRDSFENSVIPVESEQQASAFLSRASFGSSDSSIQQLMGLGNYNQWIQQQAEIPPSFHIQWAHTKAIGVGNIGNLVDNLEDWRTHSDALGVLQRDAWWDIVTNGEDQLIQRVAFALSEIMVISRNGPLINSPDKRMSYYDVLVKNALGNFETLLHDVTYHPAMGTYLSYLGNPKADALTGSHPDENYAREVMQLFTIGLYQLDEDGTPLLDAQGNTIATYNQQDVENMAKVFTGLSDDNGFFYAENGISTHYARTQPMVAYDVYHDTSEKTIFAETIAAGGTTNQDVSQALHILFMHPNTGPFIAKKLIQNLVTSNPSPDYVLRVAQVFNNDGFGERGNLLAVVKAILLDEEALMGAQSFPQKFGKIREPLLIVSHLFRAFHAQNSLNILTFNGLELYQYNSFNFNGTGYTRQEGPLEALTVFNYFSPDYAPYALQQENLVTPELELYGTGGIHSQLLGIINKDSFIYGTFEMTAELQLTDEIALVNANQYTELIDHLDTVLTAGNMSNFTKSAIINYLQSHNNLTSETLVRYAISLVMSSPDYTVQR